MKKIPLLSLISIILLTSCEFYSDSFHREFYDGTNKSYELFSYDYLSNCTPGAMKKEWYYSKYLNYYFSGEKTFKSLEYKMRDGYVGIYFKTFDEDSRPETFIGINENIEERYINYLYNLVATANYLAKETKTKDGYSRLVFKDFPTLDKSVYDSKYHLAALISYIDVYENGKKLYTTYMHYRLDTFKKYDISTTQLNTGADPMYWETRTYSLFPNEGTFLNFIGDDPNTINHFSERYLNLPFKFSNDNEKRIYTLSSFRIELIDNTHLLIPKYAIEENQQSWGFYLSEITKDTNEIVFKQHFNDDIEYYKVSLSDLENVYKTYYKT